MPNSVMCEVTIYRFMENHIFKKTIFKTMKNTQLGLSWWSSGLRLCAPQGTLLAVMCQPGWEGVGGRIDTHICMAESLCCLLETVATLFISYTPIQKIKFKVWGKKRLCVPNAGDLGLFPGWGTRSHMQPKILHATAKTQSSQINKNKLKKYTTGEIVSFFPAPQLSISICFDH